MSTVFRGLLKPTWQCQKISVRFTRRVDIKKPRTPHFVRAKVEQLCVPKYPRRINPSTPLYELCQGPGFRKEEIINPYEILLSKEALNLFRTHKYIFFFHENSMPQDEQLEMKLMLKMCGVQTRIFGRNTLKHSFVGTMYEPTLQFFHSRTLLGFGNVVDLKSMLTGLRKFKIVLMAGIIDNRLLSITELKYYSTLPNLDTMRASLVSLLNSAANSIVRHLNHHPQTLTHHLEEYLKLLKEKEELKE